MGRTKQYQRIDVLEKAMGIFWLKGFSSTSLTDLTQTTGLNKKSLYNEFGNKESLFEESLKLYFDGFKVKAAEYLGKDPLGLNNIESFMLSNYEDMRSKGCLATMTINEKSMIAPKTFEKVKENLKVFEDFLYQNLRAEYSGTKSDDEVANVSKFALMNFYGLATVNKLHDLTQDDYQNFVKTFIACLRNHC